MRDSSKLEDMQITDHIYSENGDIIFQLDSFRAISLKEFIIHVVNKNVNNEEDKILKIKDICAKYEVLYTVNNGVQQLISKIMEII